jgi:hypothetical protein
MTWTLEAAKERLGIDPADTSHDIEIQTALDVTLVTIETKLSRGLLQQREIMEFPMNDTGYIWVHRFPVQQVYSLTSASHSIRNFTVFPKKARVYVGGAGDYTLDYEGGFQYLPANLEWAMWAAFDLMYEQISNPTAGGATIIQGSGEVQSVTIQDLGTVRFDVGATSVGGIGQVSNDPAYWDWLAPWASVLKLYVHPKAMVD